MAGDLQHCTQAGRHGDEVRRVCEVRRVDVRVGERIGRPQPQPTAAGRVGGADLHGEAGYRHFDPAVLDETGATADQLDVRHVATLGGEETAHLAAVRREWTTTSALPQRHV